MEPIYLVIMEISSRAQLFKVFPIEELFEEVRARLQEYPGFTGGQRSTWARTVLRLYFPNAAVESDRLEADAKFFRSFSVVALLVAIKFFLPPTAIAPAIGSIILALVSVVLYASRRLAVSRLTTVPSLFFRITIARWKCSKRSKHSSKTSAQNPRPRRTQFIISHRRHTARARARPLFTGVELRELAASS